jgi:hypothetical protein
MTFLYGWAHFSLTRNLEFVPPPWCAPPDARRHIAATTQRWIRTLKARDVALSHRNSPDSRTPITWRPSALWNLPSFLSGWLANLAGQFSPIVPGFSPPMSHGHKCSSGIDRPIHRLFLPA